MLFENLYKKLRKSLKINAHQLSIISPVLFDGGANILETHHAIYQFGKFDLSDCLKMLQLSAGRTDGCLN